MARPKKGTKKAVEAAAKWKKTMLERYGGEEGVRRMMQKIGKQGGSISKNGGFAALVVGKDGLTGPERARLAGQKGGKINSRLGVGNGEGKKNAR